MRFGEMAFRSIFSFLTLWAFTRLMGKHQVSQLTVFDYVVGITIGSLAGAASIDRNLKLIVGLGSIVIWSLLSILLAQLALRSYSLRKIAEGEPTIVIHKGKILEEKMARMNYNLSDLLSQLRSKSIFDLNQVEFAILEPNGELSVLKKSQYQPLTPKDLNLPAGYQGYASDLIMDGTVLEDNLRKRGLNLDWLMEQLRSRGVHDVNDVMLCSLNADGTLYLDTKKND